MGETSDQVKRSGIEQYEGVKEAAAEALSKEGPERQFGSEREQPSPRLDSERDSEKATAGTFN